MKAESHKIKRFNKIRGIIVLIIIFAFIVFPLFELLPKEYEFFSVIYVIIFVASIFWIIVVFYRCPFCNSIPRGHPMPYVDLLPKACKVCGHSLVQD